MNSMAGYVRGRKGKDKHFGRHSSQVQLSTSTLSCVNERQHLLDRVLKKARLIFPFSYVRIVQRRIDKKGRSILDVGCGPGEAMKIFNSKRKSYTVGIDASVSQLKQCLSTNSHDSVVLTDIRFLPFKEKSFDIVICLHAIEHLIKDDGLRLLLNLEAIAIRQVIIATPHGFQPSGEAEAALTVLRSGWTVKEFKERGYSVRGYALKYRFASKSILFLVTSYLLAPFVYFMPSKAMNMVCVKKVT